MEIQCTGCNKRFIIPEEKIPQKDTFQILCPQCHNRITVSLKERAAERGEETKEQPQELPIAAASAEEIYSDVPLALVGEDNPSHQAIIKEALESLGYKAVLVKNPEEALERMKFVQCEVVVLNEELGGSSPSNNSANLVININDLTSLKNILKRAIDDDKQFYRVFKDCLRELGKL